MSRIVISPAILSWPHFHSAATLRCLLYVWLSAADTPDHIICLSVRALAKRFRVSYKTIRGAIQRLEREGLITTSRQGALTAIHPVNPIDITDPIIRYYKGAPNVVLGAQSGRTADTSEMPIDTNNSGKSVSDKGRTSGTIRAHIEAQSEQRAQSGRTADTPEMPINTNNSGESESDKGRTSGTQKSARVGKENKEKKNSPHTPLLKEKNTKEKDEKKIKKLSPVFFENLKSFFNRTFADTCVPSVIKIHEPRQQAVLNFMEDFSKEAITELLTRVRNTPRMVNGRSGKTMTFDTIFSEKNYFAIMEGAWDNPALNRPAKKSVTVVANNSSVKPEDDETTEETRAALLKKYTMVPSTSPAYKHIYPILLDAYTSGELRKMNIDWKPAEQTAPQTAADILRNDPNGYLAGIINNH